MQWREEQSIQDVEKREERMPDTGGLTWVSFIRKHRDNPIERYEVAKAFLPKSTAFKEAVLGLRAIIRDKIKHDEDIATELAELYKLAAWYSFYPSHSDRASAAGLTIFEQIPGAQVAKLEIEYQKLGYKKLKLLTKTDAKLLVDLYGEPNSHSTLNELYKDKWQDAEDDYLKTKQSHDKQPQVTSGSHNNLNTEDQDKKTAISNVPNHISTPSHTISNKPKIQDINVEQDKDINSLNESSDKPDKSNSKIKQLVNCVLDKALESSGDSSKVHQVLRFARQVINKSY